MAEEEVVVLEVEPVDTDLLGLMKTLVEINLRKVLLHLKLVHLIQLPSVVAVVVEVVMLMDLKVVILQ